MNSLKLSFASLRHKTLSAALTITTFAAGVAMIVSKMFLSEVISVDRRAK